jgi:hypothetical protein
VPEVAAALRTQHFASFDEQTRVLDQLNIVLRGGSAETRPARAGVELISGAEENVSAAGATIEAMFAVVVPVASREGPLCTFAAKNGELGLRQHGSPFFLAPHNLAHPDLSLRLLVAAEPREQHLVAGSPANRLRHASLSPRGDRQNSGKRYGHEKKGAPGNT